MHEMFGASRELLGAMLTGALWPAPFHSKGEPSDEGHNQPILFIPGFGGSDWSLDVLRMRLRQRDFRTYRSGIRNSGDFKKHADHLLTKLRSIAEKTGQSVALVGHSMGGRFACHLADEAPDLVRSIVTLGTPIGKRQLPALADIFHMDALAAEMGTRCHLPTTTPLTVIVAIRDGIVPIKDATLHRSELRLRYREQKMVQTDHLGLPFSINIPALVAEGVLKKTKRTVH